MILQRVPAQDALTRDGETALLFNGTTVVRLSELSGAIYALTKEPIALADLALALEERFGVPEGRSVVEAAHDAAVELIRNGVLHEPPVLE